LNPNGGSISLGHPFAATGARLVHQALRELAARNGNAALISICAAGGLGGACILTRE
jgi:acetyl-CoA acyltransferase